MPYSGGSDSKLPANVKKLSARKRRQWAHVWNSVYERTKNESRAFASANSVVKGTKALEAQKAYLYDTYEVERRRLPQDAAGYDPYGATGGVGCASCHWFIAPSGCVLVSGDISPTGKSNLYASASEMQDTIMEAYDDAETKPSVLSRIVKSITGAFRPATKDSNPLSPFVLFRDKEDKLRFVAVYSNIFEDKHNQILTTESHKEYVDWVTENKLYPDLHIWHAGDGSKIGVADMLDFVDGFAFAAGVIDSNKEEIAYKAAENDPGVSHGFVGLLQTKTGLWNRYRSFEISVLPAWAAGNETLDVLYAPGSKELFMPFDPKKREYFKSLGISDDDINTWEAAAKEQGDNLKKLNINYKSETNTQPEPEDTRKPEEKPKASSDTPPAENEGQVNSPGPTAETPGVTTIDNTTRELATKSELAYFAKAFAENGTILAGLAKSMVSLTESVTALKSDVDNLKKPADQRAAEEWASHAMPGAGFVASGSKANKPDEEENRAADDFFNTIVMGQVKTTLGIGGS